jgi:hypothetical protein
MKRASMRVLAIMVFLVIPSLIKAQDIKSEEDLRPYNPVADVVAKAITAELPNWKHKSVPPINANGPDNFSQDVIIDQWMSEESSVRVVIALYPSAADAKNEFEKFTARVMANERLVDVDNDAYAWGLNKSIALRKGSYAIYISSVALTEIDDAVSNKKSKEEAKLSKMFAKIVAKALKGI